LPIFVQEYLCVDTCREAQVAGCTHEKQPQSEKTGCLAQ
jgi:hypothetical protein